MQCDLQKRREAIPLMKVGLLNLSARLEMTIIPIKRKQHINFLLGWLNPELGEKGIWFDYEEFVVWRFSMNLWSRFVLSWFSALNIWKHFPSLFWPGKFCSQIPELLHRNPGIFQTIKPPAVVCETDVKFLLILSFAPHVFPRSCTLSTLLSLFFEGRKMHATATTKNMMVVSETQTAVIDHPELENVFMMLGSGNLWRLEGESPECTDIWVFGDEIQNRFYFRKKIDFLFK